MKIIAIIKQFPIFAVRGWVNLKRPAPAPSQVVLFHLAYFFYNLSTVYAHNFLETPVLAYAFQPQIFSYSIFQQCIRIEVREKHYRHFASRLAGTMFRYVANIIGCCCFRSGTSNRFPPHNPSQLLCWNTSCGSASSITMCPAL